MGEDGHRSDLQAGEPARSLTGTGAGSGEGSAAIRCPDLR